MAVTLQLEPPRRPPRPEEHSAAEPQPKERGCVRRGPAAAAQNPRRHRLESEEYPGGQPAAAGAPRTPPRSGKNPAAREDFAELLVPSGGGRNQCGA